MVILNNHFVEPACTFDAIARAAGGMIRVKKFIKLDDGYKTSGWREYFHDGPYLLTIFMLHMGHGTKTANLQVWADGVHIIEDFAASVPGPPRTAYAVGLVPGDEMTRANGSVIAERSLVLGADATHWYGYQIIQFEIV
jgi:hypothetical protein